MARGNLPAVLAVTLPHEGGYSVHRADRGNWTSGKVGVGELKGTNMGIAAHSYPHLDIKNLKMADVVPIYAKNYWDPVNGEMLPYGVDLATFDAGVMSGPSRGAKWLQRAVGVKQDGKVGPDTLRSVAADDGDRVVRAICAARLSFVQGLGTFAVFGRGWSRRIADIEAKGVVMWLRYGAHRSAGQVADELARQAEKASDKAVADRKGAAGAGGSSVLVGVGETSVGTGWLWIIVAVAVVAAVLMVIRGSQNRARAEAYAAAVDEQRLDEMAGQ